MASDSDHYSSLAGKGFQLVSMVLAFLFWLAFTVMLRGHMPFPDPLWVTIGSALTSLSITAVFYFALHMFWVVTVDHKRRQRD